MPADLFSQLYNIQRRVSRVSVYIAWLVYESTGAILSHSLSLLHARENNYHTRPAVSSRFARWRAIVKEGRDTRSLQRPDDSRLITDINRDT